jgi:hypothetical protein
MCLHPNSRPALQTKKVNLVKTMRGTLANQQEELYIERFKLVIRLSAWG